MKRWIHSAIQIKASDWRDDPNADLYIVKIWHEVEPDGDTTFGPVAAEEIFEIVADSPSEAKERATMQWSGPIDRIEIVAINPDSSDYNEIPFDASTDVKCNNDLLSDEDKAILRRADTSGWSRMQTDRQEDEIRKAGSYSDYIKKEKKRVDSSRNADIHESGCSFDFDLGNNYNGRRIESFLEDMLDSMNMELLGVDFRSVKYPKGRVYSQCGFDFRWKDEYDADELENAIIDFIDDEGGNFFGIDFYSIEY